MSLSEYRVWQSLCGRDRGTASALENVDESMTLVPLPLFEV